MLVKLSIFFMLLFAVAAGFGLYSVYVPVSLPEERIFVIEKGSGVNEIAKVLAQQNIIRSRAMFTLYALASGSSRFLQAGMYEIRGDVTIPQIVRKLSSGDVAARDRTITIIEGWTIDDIADYFKREGIVESRQEALSLMYDSSRWSDLIDEERYAFLREALDGARSLEGFLFPDTYRVDFDASVEEMIREMLANFAKKITPYLAEIDVQGKTLRQIVTMASLIEKEIPEGPDRRIVSGILWKRFLAGYPLQVDATITYLTGKKTTALTQDDLWIESPYNTYRVIGLPPGPISNPGLDAIEAALYPEKSPYWFYLSAPDGTTIFSRTFDEHKWAKATYLHR